MRRSAFWSGWQMHSIAEVGRMGAAAGLTVRGPAGSAWLEAVYQKGASALGEFFLERERYWGLQLILDGLNGR